MNFSQPYKILNWPSVVLSFLLEIACTFLTLLMAYAGLSKLMDRQVFQAQLSKSPFLTDYANYVSWALPVLEILIAVLLVIRQSRLSALYATLFIMAMFTFYIYAMFLFSYDLPCACGGILSEMGWIEHLWFNIGVVCLTIASIFLQISKERR
ncbi:MauE/DoxX family redox-associated membrane protein [Paraflavitalea sp. CAU 1676]|uniref:MauE/DoxX family redox-associated membrane protein n=1 Tax=Paraflavitalea sp. CAU 1676 TaxID=3032598 RepID=UPI0023DC8BFE|nr:MauE/DoxX family redox-associated membrane protein [Paraflavitalea sp. CAU 1676]MDF2191227.1 hypothetical protein [Paraflavitalea sp. CAU 1676]